MGKIFCVIGKVASGKSVICGKLHEQMPQLTPFVDDGTVDLSKGSFLATKDPVSAKKIKERYGDNNVIIIMITVNDGIRLMRAVSREMTKQTPDYNELCRKYLNDEFLFANAEYDYAFSNENVFECLAQIQETIRKERKSIKSQTFEN